MTALLTDAELGAHILGLEVMKRRPFLDAALAWRELELHEVAWHAPAADAADMMVMGYPLYPEEMWAVYDGLLALIEGVHFPALESSAGEVNLLTAPFGFVVRALYQTYRADRFQGGLLAEVIASGRFDEAVDRIVFYLA